MESVKEVQNLSDRTKPWAAIAGFSTMACFWSLPHTPLRRLCRCRPEWESQSLPDSRGGGNSTEIVEAVGVTGPLGREQWAEGGNSVQGDTKIIYPCDT